MGIAYKHRLFLFGGKRICADLMTMREMESRGVEMRSPSNPPPATSKKARRQHGRKGF